MDTENWTFRNTIRVSISAILVVPIGYFCAFILTYFSDIAAVVEIQTPSNILKTIGTSGIEFLKGILIQFYFGYVFFGVHSVLFALLMELLNIKKTKRMVIVGTGAIYGFISPFISILVLTPISIKIGSSITGILLSVLHIYLYRQQINKNGYVNA